VKENYKKVRLPVVRLERLEDRPPGASSKVSEMEALLSQGKIGPLTGFRNKMGRPFDAEIRLNDDKLPEFDFGQPRAGEEAEAVDFSGRKPRQVSQVRCVGLRARAIRMFANAASAASATVISAAAS